MKNTTIVWGVLCIVLSSCENCGDPEPYLFSTDTAFINNTVRTSLAEIEIGKLAVTKGQSYTVRALGQRIIEDHKVINSVLTEIAVNYGYAEPYGYLLPTNPASNHILMKTQLSTLAGFQFDSIYITGQIIDHEKTIIDFQTEISNSKIGDIKSFAKNYLAIIQKNLNEAQAIRDSL